MGRSHKSAETLAREGIIAQRLAQGIRTYLISLLATKAEDVEVGYTADTKGNKTTAKFLIVTRDLKVPFERVRFKMEFEHR